MTSNQQQQQQQPATTKPETLDIPYYETDHLATLAAAVLQDRCAANRSLEANHRSRYHSSRVPSISITDYMKRVGKYSRCSPECMIIAIVYLDRYVAKSQIPVTFRNAHRLIIVSVLIAAKIRDDIYYSNAYYGSIGGLQLKELNELEMDFVHILDWNTFVAPTEYHMYLCEIVRRYNSQISYGQQLPQQAPQQQQQVAAAQHQQQQQQQPTPSPAPTTAAAAQAPAQTTQQQQQVPAGSAAATSKEPAHVPKNPASPYAQTKTAGAYAGASNSGSDHTQESDSRNTTTTTTA